MLIERPKEFENWTNDGNCFSKETDECGISKGWQKQKRGCRDGNFEICTTNDTVKYVRCDIFMIQDCINRHKLRLSAQRFI